LTSTKHGLGSTIAQHFLATSLYGSSSGHPPPPEDEEEELLDDELLLLDEEELLDEELLVLLELEEELEELLLLLELLLLEEELLELDEELDELDELQLGALVHPQSFPFAGQQRTASSVLQHSPVGFQTFSTSTYLKQVIPL